MLFRGPKAYCGSAPRLATTVRFAASADRDTLVADLIAGVTPIDIKAACAAVTLTTGAKSGPNRAAVTQFTTLCSGGLVVADDLQALADMLAGGDVNDDDGKALIEFLTKMHRRRTRGVAATAASIVGSNLTSIADTALRGLAQFLVKRAELELRSFVIDQLRSIAECARRLDESRAHRLLVTTCGFLGSNTGKLPGGFGPGLRAAFARDLIALPRALVREVPAEGGGAELVWRVMLESAVVLLEDPDPMQIVARVQALTDAQAFEHFTCTEKVDGCLDMMAALYLGAEIVRVVLADGDPILISGDLVLENIRTRLKNLITHLPPDSTLGKNLKQVVDATAALPLGDWEAFLGRLRGAADRIVDESRAARAALAAVSSTSDQDRARVIVDTTRHALRAIDRGVAVATCIGTATDPMTPPSCPDARKYLPGHLADFLDALLREDLVGVMATSLALARGVLGDRYDAYISPDLERLLAFGAELANAKTPDEAEAAIEAIAMPPGGYKEKRRRDFFSITGLVGVGGGLEWVSGAADSGGASAGVIGAIGVDYNHHIQGSRWTWGAFATVIDLGGIMNFRPEAFGSDDVTGDGTVSNEPVIGFAQVFAPGLGLRVGLGDSPLVLLTGLQVIPSGRTIVVGDNATPMDPTDDPTESRSTVRVMASLGVDITIWAF